MAKYDMYQFDQQTWVVTVELPHQTLEFCTCSEFYQQNTPPKQRAKEIMDALNKAEREKQSEKTNSKENGRLQQG